MTEYSRSSSQEPNRGSREKRRHYDDRSPSRERRMGRRSRSFEKRRSRSYQRKYHHRRSPNNRRNTDKIPPSRKLFVTNIDGKFPEDEVRDDIKAEFNKFGDIKEIVVKTKQHSSNTYVFVEFEHLDDSIKAQEQYSSLIKRMKGKIFKGKQLKVQFGKGERRHDERQSGQCYVCHRDGHYARDCRDRDREHGKYERKRSRSRQKYHYRRPRHSRSSSESRRSYRRRRSYSRDRDYDRRRDYRKDKQKDHYYSRNY